MTYERGKQFLHVKRVSADGGRRVHDDARQRGGCVERREIPRGGFAVHDKPSRAAAATPLASTGSACRRAARAARSLRTNMERRPSTSMASINVPYTATP